MKILVLGDIHGRLCWYDIIADEQPDKIVFLGDYVSTHEIISSQQQCSNLECFECAHGQRIGRDFFDEGY